MRVGRGGGEGRGVERCGWGGEGKHKDGEEGGAGRQSAMGTLTVNHKSERV